MLAERQPEFEIKPCDLAKTLEQLKLGLLKNERFQPVPVSLSPLQLSHAQWKMAHVTAAALGRLFTQVAENEVWLRAQFESYPPETLASQLLAILPAQAERLARRINLARQDLVLDERANWKLIESNSIAAGMGPFSDELGKLLAAQHPAKQMAPNDAADRQADALFNAAKNQNGNANPFIVFVVEPQEDNVYDQQKLANALIDSGARVIRKTLAELPRELIWRDRQIALADGEQIDALYFRTGYNLEDYMQGNDGDFEHATLLAFRGQLEKVSVALAPTITHQLATHKWVQLKLSSMNVDQLMQTFSLTMQEAIVAHLALSTPHRIETNPEAVRFALKSGEWLLKLPGEGGGNVLERWAENGLPSGSFLMQKISMHTRKNVRRFHQHQTTHIGSAASELGIFTMGDDQHYGGYLLRTKPTSDIETGVHKGGGMIDTVEIISP